MKFDSYFWYTLLLLNQISYWYDNCSSDEHTCTLRTHVSFLKHFLSKWFLGSEFQKNCLSSRVLGRPQDPQLRRWDIFSRNFNNKKFLTVRKFWQLIAWLIINLHSSSFVNSIQHWVKSGYLQQVTGCTCIQPQIYQQLSELLPMFVFK